jgi:hypothetical protein
MKKESKKEMALDKIKKEIMFSLGIHEYIINSGDFSKLTSRTCGKIGQEAKKIYKKIEKNN